MASNHDRVNVCGATRQVWQPGRLSGALRAFESYRMKKEFDVEGLFYKIGSYKLRKFLDIRRCNANKDKPDLMVVMMNPGSSYPFDGIEDNIKLSKAHPDNTQDQIMKVMLNTSLSFARILNLSDLRTPDSNKLYKFLASLESEKLAHSIFNPSRSKELKKLFVEGVPVIYGWGVNAALVPLARKAIETISIKNPAGILKEGTEYSYYHPLPREYKKQAEWVKHVTSQITRT